MAQLPKHQIVTNWLREQIRTGALARGDRISSENELAAQFGVSRQTIRQALGALETDGLLSRARGSGTFVRAGLSEARGETPSGAQVGVVMTYLDDYVFPGILQGIDEVLTKNGLLFALGITYNKQRNEENALRQMLQAGVSGLIIEGTKSALPNANLALFDAFRARGVPIVFLNGCCGAFHDSYVVIDDVHSGELLAEYLYTQGHRTIGGIFKSDDIQGLKRYEGVLYAAKRLGMRLDDDSVLWYTTEDVETLFSGSMDPILLSRLAGVTSTVCYNDQIAANLICLLRRNGKDVPHDLSVASFDDSPLAQPMLYNLTSAVYPSREMGRTAAQVLLRQMEGADTCEKRKLPAALAIRGSVKKLQCHEAFCAES